MRRSIYGNPEWQNRINYEVHEHRFYEFPGFAKENKIGQLHDLSQPIYVWLRHGSLHKRVPMNRFGWV